jgi:hypothetical protein
MKKYLLLFLYFLFIFSFHSQVKNSSFSYFNLNTTYKKVQHSAIQPYLESHQLQPDTNNVKYKKKILNKLFSESLLDVVDDEAHLKLDPLFNFSLGPRNNELNYRYYSNVRGLKISGDLGSNLSFETRFYENQFFYADYLREKSDLRSNPSMGVDGIAFGLGRSKRFKNYGNDASLANGYLSFSPNKHLNFQIGHGRHFFGNGYRSHLISDYAPDYPYLSGQYYLFKNKLLYKHVTAWMRNLNRIPAASTPEALFVPKSFSFNQLSFSPNDKLSIAIFEGGIYKMFDIQNDNISPSFSFYSPIIGSKFFDIDSTNNIMYGINWSYKILDNIMIYNQIPVNLTNALYGFQLGLKWCNPFKLDNSFLNFEWNSSPPGMYSMKRLQRYQTYSHLGHELAHPLGSGFQEFLIIGQFSKERLFLRFNYNFSLSMNNYNENEVFEANEDLLFSVRDDNFRHFLSSSVGLFLNSSSKMEIALGYTSRITNYSNENYFSISWRTYLKNDYFDQ